MPDPLKVRPHRAAELILEDILSDEDKTASARRAAEMTAALSLKDSSDPEYTTGNVVLNRAYETPLEGISGMRAAFKTKLYAPLGFIMQGTETPEEHDWLDDYDIFFVQSMQMIQQLGRLAKAVFVNGMGAEQAIKKYGREAPEKDMKEPRYVTATGEETASCETREIQTSPEGRSSAREDITSGETRIINTGNK
ncbi:hypothetical protein JW898_02685 [Candidatus Woesearchaeota archaeon]|nr:hypothetical protein [Candidatus Woesearchaeota archaeon]